MEKIWQGAVKGSSFATAYAASLAALVIHTLRTNWE